MGKGVNEAEDMYRVTMLIPIHEWNSFLNTWNGEDPMNQIKFKEKNVKEYLDRRIIFWEETLKDLEENNSNDKSSTLILTSYIETYKKVKKRLFG